MQSNLLMTGLFRGHVHIVCSHLLSTQVESIQWSGTDIPKVCITKVWYTLALSGPVTGRSLL